MPIVSLVHDTIIPSFCLLADEEFRVALQNYGWMKAITMAVTDTYT